MSRLEEVEADLTVLSAAGVPNLARTLAAEVDELREELKAVREGKTELDGIMEAMTKGANEADIITKLLEMLKPGQPPCDCITEIGPRCSCMNQGDAANVEAWWTTMCHYRRACEIAGRTE